jgi:predicted metal-binding membrane protein
MWVVMMVAMMLPSLVPMLWRYRHAVGRTGETRLGRLTAHRDVLRLLRARVRYGHTLAAAILSLFFVPPTLEFEVFGTKRSVTLERRHS